MRTYKCFSQYTKAQNKLLKIIQFYTWIVLHLDIYETIENKQIQTMHLIIRLFSSSLQAQNVLFLQQYEIKLKKRKQQTKHTVNLPFSPSETLLGCNADMFRMRCGPEWTSIYGHIHVESTIA